MFLKNSRCNEIKLFVLRNKEVRTEPITASLKPFGICQKVSEGYIQGMELLKMGVIGIELLAAFIPKPYQASIIAVLAVLVPQNGESCLWIVFGRFE